MWTMTGTLTSLACLLAFFSLGHAQVPVRCSAPPELSFRALEYNHDLTEFRRLRGQYDEINQRSAFIDEERDRRGESYHWRISLHKQNITYEINLDKRKCEVFPAGKFYPFGVFPKAKFETTYQVGGPGESIEIHEWFEAFKIGGVAWVGSFTAKDCYPVRMFLLTNHRGNSTSTTFYDIVQGLPHPEEFIPPDFCPQ